MEYINKYYFSILIIILASILSDILYGINPNSAFADVHLSGKVLSKHYLIHEFWNYSISLIFWFYLNIKETNQSDIELSTKSKTGWIKLIYHDSKHNNYDVTNSFLSFYLLRIFIWVLVDQLIDYSIFLMIFQDLDFWMIEFIILSLLNKCMTYKIHIYRHQITAMLLSIIASLLKVVSIYLSFQDKSEEKNEYTGHLPVYYAKNNEFFKICFGIIFYIILLILRSYVNLKLKWYMDIKYIPPYKILTFFGFLGFLIYLILCVIFTFIECGKKDYCIYLGIFDSNDSNDFKYYYDSFSIYFSDFKKNIILELFTILFGGLTFFIKKTYTLLVIKNLSPVHVIFSVPFRYLLQKVVSISYSLIKKKYSKNRYKIYKLILDTLGDFASSIGFLIYLEIIVLKFCNLDYDIKKNIIRRSFSDIRVDIDANESFDNNEIIDDNLGIKELAGDDKN